MKQNVLLILTLTLLVGCQFSNRKTSEAPEIDGFTTIDLSNDYPSTRISLQSIADVEYVPLETNDAVLLAGSCKLSYISDKYVVVWQNLPGDIFVFNRNGKIHTHFNRRGQGDKEYICITSVVFDEKNEEIFVICSVARRILVYSIAGEYKRSLSLSGDLNRLTVYNFDEETMLFYDESGLGYSDDYNEWPYFFVSKKDGSVVSVLNYRLPVRYPDRYIIRGTTADGQNTTQPLYVTIPYNRRFGEDIIISDISSDTIYRLTQNREMIPLMVRKPSVHKSSDPVTILISTLYTDKFIVLYEITLDWQNINQLHPKQFIYEYETGQISEIWFSNADIPMFYASQPDIDSPRNMNAQLLQIVYLKDQADYLQGDLKQLVASLDDEDNPVLMVVKFK